MKRKKPNDNATGEYLEMARGAHAPQAAAGAPPPPARKEAFRLIGKPTPRIDGDLIVTGQAPYTHDIQLEGMLHAKIRRSPHAAAEVVSVDLSRALALPGVKAALVLKQGRTNWAGEPVAAVAAADERTAEEALKLIQVDYKPLPFVVTEDKAMAPDAPRVHDKPNVETLNEQNRGDIHKGLAEADLVLERTYRTAFEVHQVTETHASIAEWSGDRLTVYDSTQNVHGVRDSLARALQVPASKVRVIKRYMGGGFGSKLGLGDYTVTAALLAKQAQRPVKVVLTRRENSACVGYRPSGLMTVKAGAKKDGTLTALHFKNYSCGGVGRGDESAEPCWDLYTCPNVKVEEYSVYANACASRPTRAPGHTQGTLALEGLLDELAAELSLDPLELRRKNDSAKNEGDTGLPYSIKNLDQCYTLGAEAIGWSGRNKRPGEGSGRIRRGIGMASQIWWGAGVPGTLADVFVNRDGSVEVVCGTQDIGTGTRTHIAVVAAETLGLEPKDITVKIGDSDQPWAPTSGGSLTTPSVAPAVRDAALKAAEVMTQIAARKLNCKNEDLVLADKKFANKNDPGQSLTFADVARELRREAAFHGEREGMSDKLAFNTFGAQFAEVEVDTETGRIRVLKVVAVHDVGRILNRSTAESQVIGGVTQGLSAALFEQKTMDDATGRMVNPNLHDYKVATSRDIPEIVPLFIDAADAACNSLGVKGLGEPPRIPASAAIANAVFNAIGVHIREIPMTPDKVLRALKEKETRS